MKQNKKVLFITQAAAIAALYVVLTLLANALGLANYAIQVRFSEALTILPFFTPAAIPGLFIGCILANYLSNCMFLDIVFGSIATLLGAIGTYLISKHCKPKDPKKTVPHEICCTLPPIIANVLIIPFILAYVYKFEGGVPFFMLTVGIGEVISCGIFGFLLLQVLKKYRRHLFPEN